MRPPTSATATSLTATGIGAPECQDSDRTSAAAGAAAGPLGREASPGGTAGVLVDAPEQPLTTPAIRTATAHAEGRHRGSEGAGGGSMRRDTGPSLPPMGCRVVSQGRSQGRKRPIADTTTE